MGFAILALSASQVFAQTRGILGRDAPAWRVDQWFNLPTGLTTIDVDDFKGKVVYFYGFQSWCPGCHSRGFPTLRELIKRFEGEDNVAFVAVQTTFEGFHTNTAANALKTAKRYDLEIPIGHSGSDGQRSRLMSDYRTGGTPWTVIIDHDGVVRFNDFHITPDRAERLINQLREERVEARSNTDSTDVEIETLPADRGGQDLIGTRLSNVEFDRWIRRNVADGGTVPAPSDGGGASPVDDEPKATLYRWWTDNCPHCEASLPAIERLRRKYEDDGLRVVAVYHPKPPRSVEDDAIAAAADERGYHGAVALDRNWSALRRFYLSTGRRKATSASFLIDSDSRVRFVHPGPVFFQSDEPQFTQQNDDYRLIEQAIRRLLSVDEDKQQ